MNKRGISLIELLVAITITVVVISIVVVLFRLSLGALKYTPYNVTKDLLFVKKLRDSIRSIGQYYLAKHKGDYKLFFIGKKYKMSYISYKSIVSALPGIYLITLNVNKNHMYIYERPIYDTHLDYFNLSNTGKALKVVEFGKVYFLYKQKNTWKSHIETEIPDAVLIKNSILGDIYVDIEVGPSREKEQILYLDEGV